MTEALLPSHYDPWATSSKTRTEKSCPNSWHTKLWRKENSFLITYSGVIFYMSIVIKIRKLRSFGLFSKYSLSLMLDLDLWFALAREKFLQWACTVDLAFLRFCYCEEEKFAILDTWVQMNTWSTERSLGSSKKPSPGRQTAWQAAIHLGQDQQNYPNRAVDSTHVLCRYYGTESL